MISSLKRVLQRVTPGFALRLLDTRTGRRVRHFGLAHYCPVCQSRLRAFVEHEALRRHIAGWVRNRRDGTVEAVFAGEAEAVEAMIASCRIGPRAARVDALDRRGGGVADLAMRQPGEAFSVLATA